MDPRSCPPPRGEHALWATALILALTPSSAFGQASDTSGVDDRAYHFTPAAALTVDGLRVVEGGIARRGALLEMADLSAEVEVDRVPVLGSLRACIQILGISGGDFASYVGDVQGVSNIEAPASWRIYQLWVERAFSSAGLSVLVGLFDLNSEFYVTESSSAFLNASHGIGPEFAQTGQAGPSIFPATALAARVAWQVHPRVSWRGAAFDAVPGAAGDPGSAGVFLSTREGVLGVTEVDVRLGPVGDEDRGVRLGVGAWAYSSTEMPPAGGYAARRNRGAYALIEAALPGCDIRAWCAKAYARAGGADPLLTEVSVAWEGGMVAQRADTGLQIGLALARAQTARSGEGDLSEAGELNVEGTVTLPLTQWFTVQPDVQYILNPGMNPLRARTLVIGLRTGLAF